jgi:ketosteroid isomerase-like protein
MPCRLLRLKRLTGALLLCATGACATPARGSGSAGSPAAAEERDRNVRTVRAFFRFLDEKNIDAWAALWDEKGRILVPYPPAGFPDTIDGAAQIVRGFEHLFAHFGEFDATIRALYPGLDPNVVVVEYDVTATLPARDEIYRGNNVAIFEFQRGKIIAYHDYFDPRKFQVVVDATAR